MSKRTIVAAAIFPLALAACGSTTTPAQGSSGSGGGKTVTFSKMTIGYSVSTLQNQFFVGLTQGVKREAKALGIHLVFDNAGGSASTQSNQVQELVNQHVNAIILNPINASGIIPAVQQANRAHIPVITLDRTAYGGKIASFVRDSSAQMSQEAAKWLVAQLTKRYGSPKGHIVDLEGLMSTSPGQARQKGFMSVISKYPHIKVVSTLPGNFNPSVSFNAMTDAIRANSGVRIDGVFNGNDDNAIGAERAIAAAGLFKPIGSPQHIFIASIDGTSQAFAAIRSGQQDMTVAQNPMKEAEAAVQLAAEVINGKPIPANVKWPHMLIDAANINSPAAKAFGLWSLDLTNPAKGNIPNMKSLPIYSSAGVPTGSYGSLYTQASK
ncbi:MAG: sugar ABC transporter substrate-binding protein [Actinomycetota bacterium]|nr:sugar ABC transporter substrate-binding protein [Actinomycetota bacterium]